MPGAVTSDRAPNGYRNTALLFLLLMPQWPRCHSTTLGGRRTDDSSHPSIRRAGWLAGTARRLSRQSASGPTKASKLHAHARTAKTGRGAERRRRWNGRGVSVGPGGGSEYLPIDDARKGLLPQRRAREGVLVIMHRVPCLRAVRCTHRLLCPGRVGTWPSCQ
jgi:hypothetical protein